MLTVNLAKSQEGKTINLYPDNEIINSKKFAGYKQTADTAADGKIRISKVSVPQLIAYYPEKSLANRTAVIICPGGGYSILAIKHEGYDVAKAFNAIGVTAFVLKYRLPSDIIMKEKSIGPLQDAQQAIKLIRSSAKEFNIDTNKIGIMGFSAGGHLASTLGTHFSKSLIDNPQKISLRPDFMVLIYPVISFGKFTHNGSKNKLLGETPSSDQVNLYSNELWVNEQTPQSFVVHANDDKTVPSENSIGFVKVLKQNNVKAELHLYQNGGHGFGLKNKTTNDEWFSRLTNWLAMNSFLI